MSVDSQLARRVAAGGAALFGLGMVTGLWSALALTAKVTVAIPHLALAAHLNGLLGGLWLIALASTLEHLSYGDRGKARLALAVAIPAYGNWAVTVVASFLGARGLEYTGDRANDVIAGLLQTVVVLPTLVACAAWAIGFLRPRRAPAP